MGKDSDFKKSISVTGYSKLKFKCEFDAKYTPDSVWGDSTTEFILESSSTSDRKAHIGELMQFLIYVSTTKKRKKNYYFVLYLCGMGDNAPKAVHEQERLKMYFKNFPLTERDRNLIAGIYVVDQEKVSMKLSKQDFKNMQAIYKR